MSSYTEDHLVEQPAIQLMQHELGWDVKNCFGEPSSLAILRRGYEWQELRMSGWELPGKAEKLKTEKLKRSKAIDGAVEEMRSPNSWVLFALEPDRQCNRLIMNEFLFEWKTSA
jgi:hypothetical protein